MSLGKNKSSSTQEFDPELKGMLMDTYKQGEQVASIPYQPYNFATVAPMSPAQLEAMNRTANISRSGVGQSAVQEAMDTTRNEMNFNPLRVSAGQPVTVNPIDRVRQTQAVQTNQIGTGPINAQQIGGQTVQAAQFDPNAMSRYTNPYEDQVVQQTISDLDRARQMTQNQNAANAVSAGAFGGNRDALVQAETNKNFLSEVGRQTGALRQAGYNQGAQMQQADLNRQQQAGMQTAQFGQQADLANQAQQLAADRASAQFDLQGQTETGRQALQSGLAAQQLNMQGDLANQRASGQEAQLGLQAGLANKNAMMRAQQLNQAAGLQGSQNRLGAAQNMAGLGGLQRNLAYGDAAQLQAVGDLQQAQGQRLLDDRYNRFLDEREYPIRQFDVLRSAAGLLPNPLTSSSKGRGFDLGLPQG